MIYFLGNNFQEVRELKTRRALFHKWKLFVRVPVGIVLQCSFQNRTGLNKTFWIFFLPSTVTSFHKLKGGEKSQTKDKNYSLSQAFFRMKKSLLNRSWGYSNIAFCIRKKQSFHTLVSVCRTCSFYVMLFCIITLKYRPEGWDGSCFHIFTRHRGAVPT